MRVIERIKGPRGPKKDLGFYKKKIKRRMDNPNKGPEQKKRFPGGFILFLLAAILIILTVQNLD